MFVDCWYDLYAGLFWAEYCSDGTAPVRYTKVIYIILEVYSNAIPIKVHIQSTSDSNNAKKDGIDAIIKPFHTIHSAK